MPFLSYLRLAGIVVVVLLFPAGFVVGCMDEKERYDAHLALDKVIAKAAEERRLATIAADKKRKENADAENSAALATLAGDIGRLRRDRPSRGLVPSASALAGGADVACFDRPAIERAYGTLIVGLRGLGDEGAKATVNLDSAKRWAQSNTREP